MEKVGIPLSQVVVVKKRKLIVTVVALLLTGIFALFFAGFWNSSSQVEMEDTASEESSDEEKNDIDEISNNDINEIPDNDINEISDNNIGEPVEDKDDFDQTLPGPEMEDTADREEEEYKLYMDFLNGEKITADGMSIDEIIIPTGEPERRYFTDYTFFDSDEDGFVELHVRSARYYYIIDCEKGGLRTWKFLDPRTELLNNGDFLYIHVGGAPLHYNYQYIKVNKEGETIWSISFACYDDDLDGQFDEKDTYYNENNEEMSYEEWLELKQKYIDVGTDDICWITLTESI